MSHASAGAAPYDPLRPYAPLYPDVVRAGSLRGALQAEADRAGYGLVIGTHRVPSWQLVAARVRDEDGGRRANVAMDVRLRSFRIGCRADDAARTLRGGTADPADAVGALHSWIRGDRVDELAARWPFMVARGEDHGGGGEDAVAVRWARLRDSVAWGPDGELQALVEAAFAEPRLRALSPGTSLSWLRFGRGPVPPPRHDLPMAMPAGDGRYRVRTPDGRVREAAGTAGAVALLLSLLPDGTAAPR
ncbi:DUF6193 family natural product biosynthesis protein [Streptomyces lavendulae]|uniref:Uncharacterized protein n=1 Tax=Streptomyces lavendulae subsp. lavendulae TaxID=58340 RepID=A0A2K8PAQ3_STRLA|nr:DUF6193 family natural product biosynthesis protein [Streptomyces lavendulae]ATZ23819.1 hypothetical protein SLAV_09755 [Streptomyces lavendulae subsp. lavendulae]QUQ53650.1 hypothetical protein SLLC_07785 [Streptomyces lavendulae subsp. lavendulae]